MYKLFMHFCNGIGMQVDLLSNRINIFLSLLQISIVTENWNDLNFLYITVSKSTTDFISKYLKNSLLQIQHLISDHDYFNPSITKTIKEFRRIW